MQAPVTVSELPAASRRRTFSSEHFRRLVLNNIGDDPDQPHAPPADSDADSDGAQAHLHAQDPHPAGSCMHDDAGQGEAAVGPGVADASNGGVSDAGAQQELQHVCLMSCNLCVSHTVRCASDRCGVVDAGVDVFSRFRPARVLADGGVVLTPMDFESIGARVQANCAHTHTRMHITTHAHVQNTHSCARCECRRANMKWLRPWNST